jgi:hypothetical protein
MQQPCYFCRLLTTVLNGQGSSSDGDAGNYLFTSTSRITLRSKEFFISLYKDLFIWELKGGGGDREADRLPQFNFDV